MRKTFAPWPQQLDIATSKVALRPSAVFELPGAQNSSLKGPAPSGEAHCEQRDCERARRLAMQSAGMLPCASRAPCWHRATMRALEHATRLQSARLPVSPAAGRRAGAARLVAQQCSRCSGSRPASQAQRLGAAALHLLTGRRRSSRSAASGWWLSTDGSCRRCQVCRSVGGSGGDGGSAGGGDGGSGGNGGNGSSASGATAAALAAAAPLGGKEDIILLDVTGGCCATAVLLRSSVLLALN